MNTKTPGFENNDLGFLTRSDFIWYNANIFRNYTKPTRWYRELSILAGGQQQQQKYDGDLTDRQAQIYVGTTLRNFWGVNTFYLRRPAVLDDRLLRGGPVVERPDLNFTSLSVNSDSRHRVIWNVSGDYSTTGLGGWGSDLALNASYRPVSNVRVSLGPSWTSNLSSLQYVTAVTDPTATAFAGTRYVKSGLRERQLGLETRLNITFSPTMTFELYAQPFIATGAYSDFKEFTAPRQRQVAIYGKDRGTIASTRAASGLVQSYQIDPDGAGPAQSFSVGNPDFNFRSVRGNAVFRWEYHPGSTLYFACTQSRSATEPFGDFGFGRDRRGLFAAHPDNIFLVKASWWLAR